MDNIKETMNIYEKMQEARVQLQKLQIKKTGWNEFSKFDYFELGDFLPDIMSIFKALKLFSNFSIEDDKANLTITNAEDPQEEIVFTSPYIKAVLKDKSGGEPQPIQGLGASHTYLRKYLYVNALEIAEYDTVNRILNETVLNEKTAVEKAVEYIKKNYNLFQVEIQDFINARDIKSMEYLYEHDAIDLCEHIKNLKEIQKQERLSKGGSRWIQ